MKDESSISVCMTSYNGGKYIKEQIESVLNQIPLHNSELIISDDGSTDDTISEIENFKDPRIRLYRSNFKNVIKNFEYALSLAKGDIIFLSDQDDIWYPNKVSIYLNKLDQFYCVYSNLSIIDDKGLITKEYVFPSNQNQSGLIKNFVKNTSIGATMAFRKEVLNKALPFPRNIEMHDTWIGLVSSMFFEVYYIKEPCLYYRRHGENVSSATQKSRNSLVEKVEIRFWYFVYLSRLLLINS